MYFYILFYLCTPKTERSSLMEILSNLTSDNIIIQLADPSRAGIIVPAEQPENEDIRATSANQQRRPARQREFVPDGPTRGVETMRYSYL